MSVARSTTQCVFCMFRRPIRVPNSARRSLHKTPERALSQLTMHDEDVEDVESEPRMNTTEEGRKSLRAPKDKLKKHYTPKQIEAIQAAQNLFPKDAFEDSRHPGRTDPWSIDYYDDFKQIDPVVDRPVLQPWDHIDDTARLKDDDEIDDDLARLVERAPKIQPTEDGEDPEWQEWFKEASNMRLTTGSEASERQPRTALAPTIRARPKKKDSVAVVEEQARKYEDEPTTALVRLMQMTGYSRLEISKLRVKSLVAHRVVNQTRLGKIDKMYYLSVAGNGNGLLGIGQGKSVEAEDARLQSQYRAILSMKPILRYENRTIYGDVKAKVSATELELMARPPGFGLRCQQYIWEMCKCAGIRDLAARVTRARNPMNTVKAAYEAMLKQKHPEDIARARGKKLVDVRKVYYAGQV